MASKTLFASQTKPTMPKANTVNNAGGQAYALSDKHALAQLALTSTLADTFYTTASSQLTQIIDLAKKVKPEFLAKAAVFSREKGHMKDMPALLTVLLTGRDNELTRKIFPRVIDNGKMLRNFVQMVRSGLLGRKSLGTSPKKLINEWIRSRTPEQLLWASIGNSPSLVDVFKLSHPKPKDKQQDTFIKYLMGKEYDASLLPSCIKKFQAFKNGESDEVPNVPFDMLTSMDLGTPGWTAIAKNAKWQYTRMNLNTFLKHGVFKDTKMVKMIADRLRDPKEVRGSKIFPYQLLMAFKAIDPGVPHDVREALQDAMETATENIPEIDGKVFIFPDISGSMNAAVTGDRGSATSKVSCSDVAALIAAAFVRKNRNATVLPFSDNVVPFNFNPRDSVMTNANALRQLPSGGTNCSAPLAKLNRDSAKGDLVIYASDNESWMDPVRTGYTATAMQWREFKKRNPKAKLVCIDLAAGVTTQVAEDKDVLNIGGFSDHVFETIADFFRNGTIRKKAEQEVTNFVEQIDAIDLDVVEVRGE